MKRVVSWRTKSLRASSILGDLLKPGNARGIRPLRGKVGLEGRENGLRMLFK